MATIWLCSAVPAAGQVASLVRDINQNTGNSSQQAFTRAGNTVFFVADDGVNGRCLWKTDGTTQGTVLVKDLIPGATTDPVIQSMTNVNGTLFFVQANTSSTVRLWKSDGTESGTVIVRSFAVNNTAQAPALLTNVNGTLFFRGFNAGTGSAGLELWKSDGTEAGTVVVRDLTPGTTGTSFDNLVAVNNTLFFTATVGTLGRELWKSDGTDAGTVLVKDIAAGSGGSSPTSLCNVNGTLFFAASSGTASGVELWKSDGTDAGTVMVRDIHPTTSSSPNLITAAGNFAYFVATGSIAAGTAIWRSDGTETGTIQVADESPGFSSSYSGLFAISSTQVFFTVGTGSGTALWSTNGSPGGLVNLTFSPGVVPNAANMMVHEGQLYFVANVAFNERSLCKSDGTLVGTIALNPAACLGGAINVTPAGLPGQVVFAGNDATGGNEPWITDGTVSNTRRLIDIGLTAVSANPTNPVVFNNRLLFGATQPALQDNLWISDGSTAGTQPVNNALRNCSQFAGIINVEQLVSGSQYAIFLGTDGAFDREPYRTDGTAAGTFRIRNINPTQSSNPRGFVPLGNRWLFAADGAAAEGRELWITDGTEAGTSLVKDIHAGPNPGGPAKLLPFAGKVFFIARDEGTGFEPWMTDGTPNGTQQLLDINPGVTGSINMNDELTRHYVVCNNLLFFPAATNATLVELWCTDGTPAGTRQVKEIRPGTLSGLDENTLIMRNLNGKLLFTANDGVSGNEWWVSDGTEAGTQLLVDLTTGSGSTQISDAVVFNNELYFTANANALGAELWKTDGTAAGTVLVKDINPGAAASSPAQLTVAGNRLYFTALTISSGREIWVSDGTNAGTQQATELIPGAGTLDIGPFTVMNGSLYFALNTTAEGRELWKLQPAVNASTWTGAVSTEWANAANWSNGVPGPDSQVTIPAGAPRYPLVSGTVTVRQLTVASGASTQLAPGASLQVNGN